jgi:hypothetical protein
VDGGGAAVLDDGGEVPVAGDDGGAALQLRGVKGVSLWSRWGGGGRKAPELNVSRGWR